MNLDIFIYFCVIQMARYRRKESTSAAQHTGPSSSTHLGGDSLAQISTNVEAQLVGTLSTMDGEIFKFYYLIL